MLISQTAKVIWNPRKTNYYKNLGYEFTKMGDYFDVKVEHLTVGCKAIVNVQCDYCGTIYQTKWHDYIDGRENIPKDSCSNLSCLETKAKEVIKSKYGVECIRHIPGVEEKRLQTNLERYGAENPFASEEIKKRIVQTNLDKYGFPSAKQSELVKEKYKQTCLERYGVENYCYTEEFKQKVSGENNVNWKGDDAIYSRKERYTEEYRSWRKAVFDRDLYTCQKCGIRSYKGKGSTVSLAAHHIFNWKTHEDLRYDVANGATLCVECHKNFHSLYGIKNNTREQYEEFLINS